MTLIIGLLLGTGIASYTILSSSSLGFAFPTIDGELSAKPSFFRLIQFLFGRLLSWLLIGVTISWISNLVENPLLNRLLMVINIFFGIFILLYLFTEDSPEIWIAKKTDITSKHLPLFFLGFLSTFLFIAPNYSAIIWAFSSYKLQTNYIFFTNIFIGYCLVILPLLLNRSWVRKRLFYYIIRFLLFICGSTVLFLSIRELLKN